MTQTEPKGRVLTIGFGFRFSFVIRHSSFGFDSCGVRETVFSSSWANHFAHALSTDVSSYFQGSASGVEEIENLFYGKSLPPGRPIGESWEISDRRAMPASSRTDRLAGKDLHC